MEQVFPIVGTVKATTEDEVKRGKRSDNPLNPAEFVFDRFKPAMKDRSICAHFPLLEILEVQASVCESSTGQSGFTGVLPSGEGLNTDSFNQYFQGSELQLTVD